MNTFARVLITVLLLGFGPLTRSARAADPADPYQEAVRIGVQEFGRGNYAESLAAMRRAHSIDPNARTLRGMGLASFEMGNYVDALGYLERSLEHERKPLTEELRAQVQAVIRRAETNVATVVLHVRPQDAQVRIDEGPPRPLDGQGMLRLNLGTHTLELRAEGHEPQRLRLELVGGEKPELEIDLQPKERSTKAAPQLAVPLRDAKRTWGQVLMAMSSAALAGGLVSVGLRVQARRRYNSTACAPDRSVRCADEADRVEATEAAAIALFAAGGTLGITGTALLWRSRRQARADRPRAGLRCQAGLGVSCTLQF